MKKLVIFDFDGTLVDTITDVGICFNEALRECNFPQHSLDRFGSFVGGNLETIVSKMLPSDQITEENITQVKTLYRKLYLNSSKPNTKPYPGMMELLYELKQKGVTLAVNSNKGQDLLDDMVEKMFPPDFFSAVVGYHESRPSKPDPYGVDMICMQAGYTREDAIYVGDGKSDLDTAENAGIPCLFVMWGQSTEEVKQNSRPYARVDNTDQLLNLLMSEVL